MCPVCEFSTAGFGDCANCGGKQSARVIPKANLGGGQSLRPTPQEVATAEDEQGHNEDEEFGERVLRGD